MNIWLSLVLGVQIACADFAFFPIRRLWNPAYFGWKIP